MKNLTRRAFLLAVIFTVILISTNAIASSSMPVDDKFATSSWLGGLIINHTNVNLNLIPFEYIEGLEQLQ